MCFFEFANPYKEYSVLVHSLVLSKLQTRFSMKLVWADLIGINQCVFFTKLFILLVLTILFVLFNIDLLNRPCSVTNTICKFDIICHSV